MSTSPASQGARARRPSVGGLYWAARSYGGHDRRNVRSTPCELLCKGLLVANHLLHTRRVGARDVAAIEHPEFRALIEAIGPRLFTPGSGCALYRCALPPAAVAMIKDHLPARREPVTGAVSSFRARIRHEVLFELEWLYHSPATARDDEVLARINSATLEALLDAGRWGSWLPAGPELSAALARLREQGALRPCDASNLEVRRDQAPDVRHQYTYGEFMGDELPPPPPKRKPLITADAPLYWIDLHQVSFKHGDILNEGDINRRAGTGYAVTDNVHRVLEDPAFFTELMRSAQGEENQVFILPLTCFVMNGRLYSHDHKRAAASLLGGRRYMLGALNQDAWLARLREVGYHPTKGLFSRHDRGMLLYLTAADMDAWGHYFFHVGGEDHTPLMRWLSRRWLGGPEDMSEGLDALGRDVGARDPEFSTLHRVCRPSLLRSLDDPERLRAHYLGLLDDGAKMIAWLQEMARTREHPTRLRKALMQGGLVAHERVDALLRDDDAALALLAPYAAFFAAERERVAALRGRDALLRWELETVGNPLPAITRAPMFSAALRERLLAALPVLADYLDEPPRAAGAPP
ncbi:MAG: hypothetical protein H6713_17165 [Myxococcales bacterium]|nr:hypothetical protein [Myxococcales bacterium]